MWYYRCRKHKDKSRMPPFRMLHLVALVRTDVSEEHSACIIRVTKISVCQLLVTANSVSSLPILVTLIMEVLISSEVSVLTRATWCNITEDGILHSHRCENHKTYTNINQLKIQQTVINIQKEVKLLSNMNATIIWDRAPCSLYVNQRFWGIYNFQLHGWKSAEPSHLLDAVFLLG
jgi:hypothetical protein